MPLGYIIGHRKDVLDVIENLVADVEYVEQKDGQTRILNAEAHLLSHRDNEIAPRAQSEARRVNNNDIPVADGGSIQFAAMKSIPAFSHGVEDTLLSLEHETF
jgi:hypothetical protein